MSLTQSYYQFSVEESLKNLATQSEGLSDQEVEKRFGLYGKNKLQEINKVSLVWRLFAQFKELMAVILIVSGGISLYLQEYRDAVIMFSIVASNALISFVQEYKAERVMDSLKLMVVAKAKVMRGGKIKEVESASLVPGDIVVVEEGDAIPADLRVIESQNLATNDFSLTGESNPVRKFTHPIPGKVDLGDRNNLVFMGTTVAIGNGLGLVIATGMQTEIGRIAHLSQQVQREYSPLQKELSNLAKKITYLTLSVGLVMFVVAVSLNLSLREAFIFALGIAISCVPEGLPAQVSVALSLAAGRLAKERAIIKKLSAVETLGSTHVICTDKTGTLTTNEMTVQKLLIGRSTYDVSGVGYAPEGQVSDVAGKVLDAAVLKKYELFFQNGVLASNGRIAPPDQQHPKWYAIGDPTESALITLSAKVGIDVEKLDKNNQELRQFTFDAVRKRMSSIRKTPTGQVMVFAKGAPLSLLDCCSKIWDGQRVRKITEEDRKFIKEQTNRFSRMAMRNLSYAYRELDEYDPSSTMEQVEQNLVWLGQVSMIDPPREEVQAAIEVALKAYIRVIIITGDYALTAKAIAKKIGMNKFSRDKSITVVTGQELEKMSDIDLLQKLICTNLIFARTSPQDKLRIVSLLKKAGEIVAVTGDGVNDAPALKKADIGVAMGKTGTEVAKNSAELILLDDSFATLVAAIKEGRIIFNNLKKTIVLSLTSNGGELFAVLLSLLFAALMDWPLAIIAVQILAVDLVGEMLPLTFLTNDPAQPGLMTEAPRQPNEHIVNKKTIWYVTIYGLVMGSLAYVNFITVFWREGVSPVNIAVDNVLYLRATTITYISIVFIQWVNILARRTGNESVFNAYLFTNWRLWVSYGVSLVLLLNIVYNPYIQPFLYTAALKLSDWLYVLLAAFIFLIIREMHKWHTRVVG